MSELCGWFGATQTDESALQSWLDGMPGKADSDQLLRSGQARWQLRTARPDAWSVQDERVGMTLTGQPMWQGAALTGEAREALAAIRSALCSDPVSALDGLRGNFLLVFHDRDADRALIATDRIGIHPLCYASRGDQLIFGTDARSVARHPAVSASLSSQAVFSYLYAHMVPSPDTIYDGVQKLLPAQYLLREKGRLQTGFYWRMPYRDPDGVNFDEAAERFHALLRQGVTRCADDAALGCFLSGGTDSSTVTGVLSKLLSDPVDSYSIGFDAEGYDEIGYARIAAARFGCRTHEYYVTPADVVAAVPLVAASYDEPFGNASAVPTYFCSKLAAQDGKRVLLAGDGGDELFGGNARYAKQKVFDLYWNLPEGLRKGLVEPLVLGTPLMSLGPLRKVRSYVEQARVPLPDRLESYNFLERGDLRSMFEPDFLSAVDPARPLDIAREAYARAPQEQSVNCMMHLDLKQTLADNDLRKVTRMCAQAGIDVRYPLLDDDLVDFSAALPLTWKVKGSQLRWFFKEALKDFLPREIITKSKHGFGLPFGAWMSSDKALQQLAYDSLLRFKRRHVLKPAYLDQLIEAHRTGHANYYGVMIWVLMMLDQWLEANEPAGI